jgi:hypothetical protein
MVIAVIVEPRRHKALAYVVTSIRRFGPMDAPILIMHGTENAEYVKRVTRHITNVLYHLLPVRNMTPSEYSHLLLDDVNFWSVVSTEAPKGNKDHVLIFQTDSMILRGSRPKWRQWLEETPHISYVGAPWEHRVRKQRKRIIGNGGFSLRHIADSRHALANMSTACRLKPEDVAFCEHFVTHGSEYNLPSLERARSFAWERTYQHHTLPIGVHKIWEHIPLKYWQTLCRRRPGLRMLQMLQT